MRRQPRIRQALTLIAAATALCLIPVSPAGAVVGGKPAALGQFPYVADVLIGDSATGCSGVLVEPDWVLTAGHCASISGLLSAGLVPGTAALGPGAFTVVLGTPEADGAGGETHSVSEVIIDSAYTVGNGVGNDVTLLKLSRPSAETPMLVAPDDPRLWAAGTLGTIVGFGTTSESATSEPTEMMWAQVPYITDAHCASEYPPGDQTVVNDGYFDASNMICAGYPQGGVDTCEGDSGGPLLSTLPDGRLTLVALTSFGRGCAEAGHAGVYDLLAAGPIRAFIAAHLPGALAPASVLTVPAAGKSCERRGRILRSGSGSISCR